MNDYQEEPKAPVQAVYPDMLKQRCGFALLTPERRKEIASKGGKAAQAKGTGHRFTKEEAIAAGSLGGKATRRRKETKS